MIWPDLCGRLLSKIRACLAGLCLAALVACTGSDEKDRTWVVLTTDLGNIELEIFTERAPQSSAIFLAYVDAGFYTGAAFYRTVMPENDRGTPPISVVQGGVLDLTKGLPPVPHETTEVTGVLHTDGVISLARSDPGTGSGTAFFICVGDQPGLDYGAKRNPDGLGFAAFGKVVRGMDVVRNIHQREALGPSESEYTQGQVLTEVVMIRSAVRR
jgi:peptidyl-prolyl cis-trans isomerase A (cyclophilin A)